MQGIYTIDEIRFWQFGVLTLKHDVNTTLLEDKLKVPTNVAFNILRKIDENNIEGLKPEQSISKNAIFRKMSLKV